MREPPAERSIALVDDDRNILASVAIALEAEGYRVRAFADPVEALAALAAEPADLAVLDIKMPRLDGFELLTQLRRRTRMPVIFLTSKDDEQDERVGLELGADDYIKKPFSVQLLIARIRALLRRVDLARAPAGEEAAMEASEKVIHRGALALNPARHLCTWRDLPVALTVTEFLIVQALAQRPGLVKNRNQIMDAAYDDQIYVDDRTIDSHIKRIRRKFREVDPAFAGIETLYGIGYRYKDA